MSFKSITTKSTQFVADNSPAILTAVGVTGLVTTAYLTGKATFRAAEIIRLEQDKIDLQERPLEPKERFELVWKLYIPAVGVGMLSCAAIIGSNRIGTRRAAAVTTAYALSEKAFSEYRDKVVEKIGENKEKAVRDELAHDRVIRDYGRMDVPVLSGGPGRVLCHDAYSGRFFESTIETVNKAVNDVNREINLNDSATVSDFYDSIGLTPTSISDEFGWNSTELLTLKWTTIPGPVEGSPAAHSFDFESRPILRPWSTASFR